MRCFKISLKNSVWELLCSGFHSYHGKLKKEWKMDSISRLCACSSTTQIIQRFSYAELTIHVCQSAWKILEPKSSLWTPVECWQLAEVYSDIRCYKIQISNINRLGTNTAGSLHQHIYMYIIHIWRREKLLCMKKDFLQLENQGVSQVLWLRCMSCVTGSASHVNKVCV